MRIRIADKKEEEASERSRRRSIEWKRSEFEVGVDDKVWVGSTVTRR
jgi:hypothetical protein